MFPQNHQYRHCRFHGEVGIPRLFGAKIHSIELGLVGQILGTASVIMAEIKSSRKDHEVKGAVQAKPFQLCHLRQVESVCVRASNPVHSALAAWVALLAHAGLRAEDSQRLKVGSCGFTDFANSRNLQESQASRCLKHALGCTTLWCSG